MKQLACMGERKMVLVGKPEGDHLEDQGINGRMGSQCISGRLVQGVERIQLAGFF
jgi:hypothetical protein